MRSLLKDYRFTTLLSMVVIVLLAGMIFYNQVEGWSLLDSLYFSSVTLTTVGYGDLYPQTGIGKMFTIVYIFAGIAIILSFFKVVADHTFFRFSAIRHLIKQHEKKEEKALKAIKRRRK